MCSSDNFIDLPPAEISSLYVLFYSSTLCLSDQVVLEPVTTCLRKWSEWNHVVSRLTSGLSALSSMSYRRTAAFRRHQGPTVWRTHVLLFSKQNTENVTAPGYCFTVNETSSCPLDNFQTQIGTFHATKQNKPDSLNKVTTKMVNRQLDDHTYCVDLRSLIRDCGESISQPKCG